MNMRPPSALTAPVIFFQAAICSGLSIAGVRMYPMPLSDGAVPSVMINAAEACWA
jgi:hypothetical protein